VVTPVRIPVERGWCGRERCPAGTRPEHGPHRRICRAVAIAAAMSHRPLSDRVTAARCPAQSDRDHITDRVDEGVAPTCAVEVSGSLR